MDQRRPAMGIVYEGTVQDGEYSTPAGQSVEGRAAIMLHVTPYGHPDAAEAAG
jgi:hypothetical protein